MKTFQTDEIQHAQQHLANERTFLAWVRTSIAIMGIGFLAAGLVFHSTRVGIAGRVLSMVFGLMAGTLSILLVVVAAKNYFLNMKAIQSDRFIPRTPLVTFTTVSIVSCSIGFFALLILYMFAHS